MRFDGYRYKFSPYALVWNMDSYFVIGCRMRKGENCIHKFRVDKICAIQMEEEERLPLPEGFDLAAYCDSAFLMYGDETTDVTLSCTYDLMEKVIDRFGEDKLQLEKANSDDLSEIEGQIKLIEKQIEYLSKNQSSNETPNDKDGNT